MLPAKDYSQAVAFEYTRQFASVVSEYSAHLANKLCRIAAIFTPAISNDAIQQGLCRWRGPAGHIDVDGNNPVAARHPQNSCSGNSRPPLAARPHRDHIPGSGSLVINLAQGRSLLDMVQP